ncbi:MAG: hypothetical protein NZM43_07755 [Saprospiraceae bacterium]|nr:hypothetical protein [Saprospiraceae bacterium]MDW8484201.1 hypothetical protein [Saprospiraceae bacterium]
MDDITEGDIVAHPTRAEETRLTCHTVLIRVIKKRLIVERRAYRLQGP